MSQTNLYVIFTDATTDLPPEDFQRYQIQVLPMLYRLSGQDALYEGSFFVGSHR